MKLSECFSNSLLDIGKADVYILLLLGDTDGFSLVSGGLGVLAPHLGPGVSRGISTGAPWGGGSAKAQRP